MLRGLLNAEELLLHKIVEGLSRTKNLDKKHATKQVDRLLSNKKLDILEQSKIWVPYIIGQRTQVMVSMGWTDFDDDNQSMIAINLITDHGRATPLLWKTVNKSSLKNNRARSEAQILSQLKIMLPAEVNVIILADRGFADQKFFEFIEKELQFSYIIRIRGKIYVTDQNNNKKLAKEWLLANGRVKTLTEATVKTRTHSLLRQGIFYYKFFTNFIIEEQQKLLEAFEQSLQQQIIWTKLLYIV